LIVALTKKRKSDPNRFQQQDNNSLFSFDPIRRNVLKWGTIAGASGGFLMIQQQVVWQIIGVFIIVFMANYHISKAAQRIPRWQATLISFAGVIAAMFGVIIVGTIVMAYYQPAGG
jgi:hypothetical protein